MARWKAKVNDTWYEVEDIVDQGDGEPNLYLLKNADPVEQNEIDDLQIAASFIDRLEDLYFEVTAKQKGRDLRKQLRSRDLKEIKKAKKLEQKRAKKNLKNNGPERKEVNTNETPEDTLVKKADTRFLTKIRSIDKPIGFIICFRGQADEEKRFIENIKSIINTPNASLLYQGNKGVLDRVHVYILSASKQVDFDRQAKLASSSPSAFVDLPNDFLSQDEPFAKADIEARVVNALGGDTTLLKRELNAVMSKLRRDASGGESGKISAMKMSSEIPLNYARFFEVNPKAYNYYTGGNPPSAGTKGTRFVLVDEKEGEHFLSVMNKFKPLDYFFNDLYHVSDIDPDFKYHEPQRVTPPRALLLLAKNRFDLEEAVENITPDMQALLKGKKQEEQEEQEESDSKSAEKITQKDLLEAFIRMKMGIASSSKPGSFKKMRYYIGNDWIHFNKDFTVAILWGSRTKSLSMQKKEILSLLPFVKDATLTYLK